MVPNKQVLQDLQAGLMDELATCYKNMCDSLFEYAMSSPIQQTETTKRNCFRRLQFRYRIFSNIRNYIFWGELQ